MLRSLIVAFLLVNLSLDAFGVKITESSSTSRNLKKTKSKKDSKKEITKKSKKGSHNDGSSSCVRETVQGSIEDVIHCVSLLRDLENPDSAQAKAADWMLMKDENFPKSTDTEASVYQVIQRYVLAVYYYSTGGDSWRQCGAVEGASDCNATATNFYTGRDNFLSGADECYWFSIGCRDGLVTDIRLANSNGLTGTLPPEIGELVHLENFDQFRNDIGGSIPSEIGNLKKLRFMDFTRNELTGPIPDAMFELTNMYQLDLKDNKLTGTIPDRFDQLTDLNKLYIGINYLTGSLPESLGRIPMSNVEIISVRENELTGSIPDAWYGGLTKLSTLDASNNNLTGTLSPEIEKWENLAALFIDGNNLTGIAPVSLCGVTLLVDPEVAKPACG